MIQLRPVTKQDKKLLFQWRNLPEIIENSAGQKPVTAKEHTKWFNELLNVKRHLAFVVAASDEDVGHLRFDVVKDEPLVCVVSIYLLKEHRSKGYGAEALRLGIEKVKEHWPTAQVVCALVAKDNRDGVRFFQKCGFSREYKYGLRCWECIK